MHTNPCRVIFLAAIVIILGGTFSPASAIWNNDYPCPDLDCSGGVYEAGQSNWAPGMFFCSVNSSRGGYCLECTIDVETQRPICGRAEARGACKCEIKYIRGQRTCTTTAMCEVW